MAPMAYINNMKSPIGYLAWEEGILQVKNGFLTDNITTYLLRLLTIYLEMVSCLLGALFMTAWLVYSAVVLQRWICVVSLSS